ncbi:peptidase S41 [Halioglobus japonicus]|uniref:Peptidase S41 n=1 Tax=Halioglobus japonicus TaxID=930805 RepID=A0AAP8SPS4_9GAMM|nr:carboxy terminal-processing peptidase [Halioglobus japonicus]AQA19005.1 peptidase S41 [Halioglobus japonicus]PLW87977.1 peptidase S41 [Halioglobus japonicus]GHD20323.1 tail-specific protease [Halioglobus japonicus]
MRTIAALGRNTLLGLALIAPATPSLALIEYSDAQRETIVELVEQLEDRHYAKLKYDDELSSQHLDAYINSLDGSKMFFTAADIAEFEQYRSVMDDQLPEGNLSAGYAIFNRFHERLETRLEAVLSDLPATVAAMDFDIDETYMLDTDDRPWADSQDVLDDRWRKHIKNQVLGLRLADKPTEEIPETLDSRYRNQLKRVQQYNSQDVFQIYANALTELYDPHTNYFSPRRSENFNINMSLSLEGIGAVLQVEDEYTKVSRLVPKGPADKQGELQASDRIVGVGQGDDGDIEDVIGWRLDEVVELIRGPKDTTVRLQVIPAKSKSTDERKTITIVRNKVKLEEQSAQKKILEVPNGDEVLKVGVIDIPAFYIDFEAMRRGDKDYKSTTRDVKKLLQELQEEGIDGLVMDLRNNGGGSLQEANELTGLFIEYGPTVQIRHSSRRVWRDGKRLRSEYYDGPLVVLINRLSASASEIFAGAIQDYERGIIVGDRSFGKGTVQTLTPLTEGQLKITESKFYRISGDSTQHRGVVPDITFPSVYDPEQIGESSLDHALNWDQINGVRHRRYDDLTSVLPRITTLFKERSVTNPDFVFLEDQIALAAQTRELKELPLNEAARIALRESQEEKALAIENKRRVALGEEPLTSLDEEEETDEDASDETAESEVADAESDEATDEEDDNDVLLTEAGNVLVDALVLKQQRYAAHSPPAEE